MHKQKTGTAKEGGRERERERGEEDFDLRRPIQNTVDELDQLLNGLNRFTGQEVLLVGCVEDDNRGHCHLAEEKQKTQQLIFLTSVTWSAIINTHR